MKKQLYVEIRNRLKTIDALRWIAWHRGQFHSPEEHEPFPLPAALIQFGDIRWRTLSGACQEGDLTLYVEVYFRASKESLSVDEQDDVLGNLQLLDEVYEALQFFNSERVQSLERQKDEILKTEPKLLGFRTTFTSRVVDSQLVSSFSKRKASMSASSFGRRA